MELHNDEIQAQEIARKFQKRWPEEIDDFLPPHVAVRCLAVIKLSHIDLELRWRNGETARAIDYFRRYSKEWAASGDKALELIVAEYEFLQKHVEHEAFCKDYGDRHDGLIECMRKRFPQSPSAPRYLKHKPHHRGGLGEVYQAYDQHLGRWVAVKRMGENCRRDPVSRKQFLFEAEVTGRLEHPGILPVYSLDRGDAGEPEYAMRFIDRESLRTTIKRLHASAKPNIGFARSREFREMLGRFVFIGRTIAFAHERGYLHRDLKPDNIMLGHFGETWVIDWGLAKFYKPTSGTPPAEGSTTVPTSAAIHDSSSSVTNADGSAGYCSPEQARGGPTDPRSDVYSLGATLDFILTNHDPANNKVKDVELTDFVVTPPRKIASTIPRALKAIVLKAMADEPEERYPSADSLANDVQAFLDGERVSALRREPVTDRVFRMIRKHQTATVSMAAGMIVAVVLIYAISDIAYQRKASEVATQQALTKSQSDLINALSEISRNDVFEKKFHPIESRSVANALTAIENLRRAEKTASPEVRESWAITALKVADETRKRGSKEDSKQAYRLARDIYSELFRDFPKNEEAPKNLAACHQKLANLEMETGETEAARESLLAGASLLEAIVNDDHSDHEARFHLAKIRLTMAMLEKDRHNMAAASREAQSGLKLMESLAKDQPDNLDYCLHQAKGLSTLGTVQGLAGDYPRSLETHKKGLAIRERLVMEDPKNLDYLADLALSLYNIGFLKGQILDAAVQRPEDKSRRLAAYKDAIDTLPRCWEIREKLHRATQGDTRLFAQLCQVQGEIGSLLLRSGRTDSKTLAEAARLLGSALQNYEQLKSKHPTSTEFSEPSAACCQNLGVIQLLRNDSDAGFASFTKAENKYRSLLLTDPKNCRYRQMLGQQAFSVGNLLVALDRSKAKARQYLEKAREIQKALVEADPENVNYQRQSKMTTDLLQSLP